MKTPLTLLLVFCLLSILTSAQAPDPAFEAFVRTQDSLMIQAYYDRNEEHYQQHLNTFLTKYKKADKESQKTFTSSLYNAYYNFCCLYSLSGKKEKALEYLEKSIENGYYGYMHMQADTDLDAIRNEQKFKDLVEPLREISDYMYILKKAKQYNSNDLRPLPEFTYQSAEDSHLQELRQGFQLDSIAGKGNDVSQIINLMHWIHYLIPHDGNSEIPAIKNAMDLIAACKSGKRGLNCRGLATVLNECYLSLGYQSRIVTCLPKDSLQIDSDCHVINSVFCPSLNKWIWIDPTNDAYVMNEKGELLSIFEVRERLISDQPLILNPDANWNRVATTVKEDYLYQYMAKNLYILECPISSEYDMETRAKGKTTYYVQLLPLDYHGKNADKAVETFENKGYTIIIHKTTNPDLFWKIP